MHPGIIRLILRMNRYICQFILMHNLFPMKQKSIHDIRKNIIVIFQRFLCQIFFSHVIPHFFYFGRSQEITGIYL